MISNIPPSNIISAYSFHKQELTEKQKDKINLPKHVQEIASILGAVLATQK